MYLDTGPSADRVKALFVPLRRNESVENFRDGYFKGEQAAGVDFRIALLHMLGRLEWVYSYCPGVFLSEPTSLIPPEFTPTDQAVEGVP